MKRTRMVSGAWRMSGLLLAGAVANGAFPRSAENPEAILHFTATTAVGVCGGGYFSCRRTAIRRQSHQDGWRNRRRGRSGDSEGDRTIRGWVEEIEVLPVGEAPYPLDKIKYIIGPADKDIID